MTGDDPEVGGTLMPSEWGGNTKTKKKPLMIIGLPACDISRDILCNLFAFQKCQTYITLKIGRN